MQIVEFLREDPRASLTDIADAVGVSESTVSKRLDNLLEDEIDIQVKNAGRGVMGFVHVETDTSVSLETVIESFPKRFEAYEVAGSVDIIAEGSAETSSQLNEYIDVIRSIDGVVSTETFLVLE